MIQVKLLLSELITFFDFTLIKFLINNLISKNIIYYNNN